MGYLSLILITCFASTTIYSWSLIRRNSRRINKSARLKTSTSLFERRYTKGTKLYPATNEKPITLGDSFPNGIIPPPAYSILNEKNEAGENIWTNPQDTPASADFDASRRMFFLVPSLAIAATSAKIFQADNRLPQAIDIPEVIGWIDRNCDRRFLHAVVASNYQFLYRGAERAQTSIRKEAPDLLSSETYNSPAALSFFRDLESILDDEPVKPSNGHLATTSILDASEWGSAVSIWPMSGAHYAWFRDEGVFYPGRGDISRDQIIVDGKDCGKESLEDVLRSRSCEVMVFLPFDNFLAVPASMDEEVRKVLKESFII